MRTSPVGGGCCKGAKTHTKTEDVKIKVISNHTNLKKKCKKPAKHSSP